MPLPFLSTAGRHVCSCSSWLGPEDRVGRGFCAAKSTVQRLLLLFEQKTWLGGLIFHTPHSLPGVHRQSLVLHLWIPEQDRLEV